MADFEIIFEKLEEAKLEHVDASELSQDAIDEIQENIRILEEFQKEVELDNFTMFTRA